MQIRERSCVPATPNEPQVLEHALHHDHSEKPAAENKFAVGTNLTILVSFFKKKNVHIKMKNLSDLKSQISFS